MNPVRVNGTSMDRNEKYVALSRTTNRNLLRYTNIHDDDFRVKGPSLAIEEIRKKLLIDFSFTQPAAKNRLLVYDSKLVSLLFILFNNEFRIL